MLNVFPTPKIVPTIPKTGLPSLSCVVLLSSSWRSCCNCCKAETDDCNELRVDKLLCKILLRLPCVVMTLSTSIFPFELIVNIVSTTPDDAM